MDSHSLQLFVVWLLCSLVIPHVPLYSDSKISDQKYCRLHISEFSCVCVFVSDIEKYFWF